jgi:predicted phosphodiesterase
MLIALDTNMETTDSRAFAQGQVGERQLSFLKTILPNPAFKDRIKILFFHHHPFDYDYLTKLIDAKDLLNTIENLVDIVCFGHQHVSRLWENTYGIKYILAAGSLPKDDQAREINIMKGDITVKDIKISSIAT